MTTLSLDAHIWEPHSETKFDGFVSGSITNILSFDAVIAGPADFFFDAILVQHNTSQKLTNIKTRSTTFKGFIFSQDG